MGVNPVGTSPSGSRGANAAKNEKRRTELAESALRTLGERGYARTSLREIAQSSTFSHGVLHYYFADKTELILYCVRLYKAKCTHRYDQVIAESTTADGLRSGFAHKLAECAVEEAPMHRLWYDIRSQSLFESDLRGEVEAIDDEMEQTIGRVLDRLAELAGVELVVDHGMGYGMLDGIFEQAILDHHNNRPNALELLVDRIYRALGIFLPG